MAVEKLSHLVPQALGSVFRSIIVGIKNMLVYMTMRTLWKHGMTKTHANDPKTALAQTLDLVPCAVCKKTETKPLQFLRCSGCLTTIYCSKTCQLGAWKTHKAECKCMEALIGTYSDCLLRFSKRMARFNEKYHLLLLNAGIVRLLDGKHWIGESNVLMLEMRKLSNESPPPFLTITKFMTEKIGNLSTELQCAIEKAKRSCPSDCKLMIRCARREDIDGVVMDTVHVKKTMIKAFREREDFATESGRAKYIMDYVAVMKSMATEKASS